MILYIYNRAISTTLVMEEDNLASPTTTTPAMEEVTWEDLVVSLPAMDQEAVLGTTNLPDRGPTTRHGPGWSII
jgi:hypothetical protein